MYIFYFEFFDDFQEIKNKNSKSSKNSKTKMYLLPTNHVVSTKKFQSKILCILSVAKKDKFGKILESLAWSRWMEGVGWMGDPVTPPRSSIDSIFIVVLALLGTVS